MTHPGNIRTETGYGATEIHTPGMKIESRIGLGIGMNFKSSALARESQQVQSKEGGQCGEGKSPRVSDSEPHPNERKEQRQQTGLSLSPRKSSYMAVVDTPFGHGSKVIRGSELGEFEERSTSKILPKGYLENQGQETHSQVKKTAQSLHISAAASLETITPQPSLGNKVTVTKPLSEAPNKRETSTRVQEHQKSPAKDKSRTKFQVEPSAADGVPSVSGFPSKRTDIPSPLRSSSSVSSQMSTEKVKGGKELPNSGVHYLKEGSLSPRNEAVAKLATPGSKPAEKEETRPRERQENKAEATSSEVATGDLVKEQQAMAALMESREREEMAAQLSRDRMSKMASAEQLAQVSSSEHVLRVSPGTTHTGSRFTFLCVKERG